MTQIAISDTVAAHLASVAADRGCSLEDLASVLLEEGLRRDDEFVLSSDQETHLLESIGQAQRGELVDGELVMARFGQVMKEIKAK